MIDMHSMPEDSKALVVGTTPDYVDWIRKACPNRALFLTEPDLRATAEESPPSSDEEVLCRLDDMDQVRKTLKKHLEQWGQNINGVACFDCASLEAASLLAEDFGLAYPDLLAIGNCRDKGISKQLWHNNDIACPKAVQVESLSEVIEFLLLTEDGIVLKPLAGSGSELVFKCRTIAQCREAFDIIKAGLKKKNKDPLFMADRSGRPVILAEELIQGPEFSCDFIVENHHVSIIRMTRKVKPEDRPFGTVSGYVIPASLPMDAGAESLEQVLLRGANALGIQRSICMVDFIVKDAKPFLIEMTPRPGGDCLPFLLQESGNLDILKLTLDFAQGMPWKQELQRSFKPCIGVRIHARKSGVLQGINTGKLNGVPGIRAIHMIRKPGHVIIMPPADYDSWFLGHVILQPNLGSDPEVQCSKAAASLKVEIL